MFNKRRKDQEEVDNQQADYTYAMLLGGFNIAITLSYISMASNISFTTMAMTVGSVLTGMSSIRSARNNLKMYSKKFDDAPDFKLERSYASSVLIVVIVLVIVSWVAFALTSLAISM